MEAPARVPYRSARGMCGRSLHSGFWSKQASPDSALSRDAQLRGTWKLGQRSVRSPTPYPARRFCSHWAVRDTGTTHRPPRWFPGKRPVWPHCPQQAKVPGTLRPVPGQPVAPRFDHVSIAIPAIIRGRVAGTVAILFIGRAVTAAALLLVHARECILSFPHSPTSR